MLTYQLTSSLEKCFPEQSPADFPALKEISVLKNQKLSFQLVYREEGAPVRYFLKPTVTGADAATYRTVELIPSAMPAYLNQIDEDYITTTPRAFPDLLLPLSVDGLPVFPLKTGALWIDIEAGALPIGVNTLTLTLTDANGETVAAASLTVTVINAELPEQTLIHTEWFHTDSLISYYRVPAFSEEYWRITENFMRSAYGMGINVIFTPVLTPPLDTAVGGERPTVQLVDIERRAGKYSFSFEKFDRYVALAKRIGFKYFEINHLFTQWGAAHAPKVMATTENGYERIFGWETEAGGAEYRSFLAALIPALRSHLVTLGIHDACYFHISDEPNETQLESYRTAREGVIDLLSGCKVIDALSRIQYYEEGLVAIPVPGTNHIAPFLEKDIDERWTYYCCGQCVGTSNRYFAMTSARTRYIGTQLFYYNIKGFLQWGFNFYFSRFATEPVNPFLDSTGNGFTPSGDCYIVYPAPNGEAWESIRYNSFREGLEDMRAMQLAESLVGREAVKALLDEHTGGVVFDSCVNDSVKMLALREAVNALIAKSAK